MNPIRPKVNGPARKPIKRINGWTSTYLLVRAGRMYISLKLRTNPKRRVIIALGIFPVINTS